MSTLACFLERDLMPIVYRNKHFVTVSPSSKAEMLQFGLIGKGIELVHNGVDLESFKPAEKSIVPIVLYLGRLKAYKSVDVLLTAFKILLDNVPDAMLIIAGSGEEEAHLKRLVSQLNLGQKVVFTGKVSEREKIELLQKSWVLVNPSFMEGWGITTIEANACGTPVVGADVPGLRDSIRNFETGYLVPHGDSHGFANKIGLLIRDRRLRLEFTNQSLQWAKNFSWDKSVNKMLAVMRSK
jgi:glycosyltransferase involved in cell wall biosynthesis